MANKKQVAGVDYEAFGWQDYIGGPYSYVSKFEQDSPENIIRRGVWDRRITKVFNQAAKIHCDELIKCYKNWAGQTCTKRFYGKARIAHVKSKSGRIYEILISYNTAVAMLDSAGRFVRLWNGWSATTARHIDAFMNRYGLRGLCKADWLNLPIGKPSGIAVD